MASAVYDETQLESAIEKSSSVNTNVNSIIDATSEFLSGIDKRIIEYYSDIFNPIKSDNTYLNSNVGNISIFKTWLSNTYDDYTATNTSVKNIANSAQTYSGNSSYSTSAATQTAATAATTEKIKSELKSIDTTTSDADELNKYYISAEEWANLPSTEKDAIIALLQEVGYTDEEILDIKNGKYSVSKTTLLNLSSEIEDLYKKDPSIRAKIIEFCGVDIFDDNGNVNKNKLALLMLVDNKSEKYNISEMIDSYTKSLNSTASSTSDTSTSNSSTSNSNTTNSNATSETSTTDAATSVSTATKSNESSSETHSGASYSASSSSSKDTVLSEEDEALLDSLVNGDEESEDLADVITTSAKSALGAVKSSATSTTTVKKSAAGAIPIMAGLGATGATAGGLGMFMKKKNEDEENNDNLDDEDELLNNTSNETNNGTTTKEWLNDLGIGVNTDSNNNDNLLDD